jgi:hypothetical protein
MASSYDVLGVEPSASPDEIRQAFKTLAQIYHPDRYADAPAVVKAEAVRRMQELTRAYDSLINATKDSGRSSGSQGPVRQNPRPPSRPSNFLTCDLCGRAPAIPVKVRRSNAFMYRSRGASLCKECGLDVLRQSQVRTAAGAVMNPLYGSYALGLNATWQAKLRKLSDPIPPEEYAKTGVDTRHEQSTSAHVPSDWHALGTALGRGLLQLIPHTGRLAVDTTTTHYELMMNATGTKIHDDDLGGLADALFGALQGHGYIAAEVDQQGHRGVMVWRVHRGHVEPLSAEDARRAVSTKSTLIRRAADSALIVDAVKISQ